jgi:hypothetical protein
MVEGRLWPEGTCPASSRVKKGKKQFKTVAAALTTPDSANALLFVRSEAKEKEW